MTTGDSDSDKGDRGSNSAPSTAQAAIRGLCPRCGAPTLFAGITNFAPRCSACGLDFASFNVGDGPAAFLTLIWGTIVVILAVWLELAVDPPWWLHVILWLPLVTLGTVMSLRIAKAALMALEYSNAAREGRIADREP